MMSIIYNIVLRHLLLRYNKRHRLTVTPGYNKTSDWISREIILLEIESLLEIWKLYGGDEKDEKIHLIPAEGLNTQFTHRQRNTGALYHRTRAKCIKAGSRAAHPRQENARSGLVSPAEKQVA